MALLGLVKSWSLYIGFLGSCLLLGWGGSFVPGFSLGHINSDYREAWEAHFGLASLISSNANCEAKGAFL